MVKYFMVLWVTGLFTLVPYGTYYLFFEATRDEYAFVIVSVLFWIFGYWGVIGPIISALKVHKIMKAFDNVKSGEELKSLIRSKESNEVAIDLIVSENKVPRFVASYAYKLLVKRLSENQNKK